MPRNSLYGEATPFRIGVLGNFRGHATDDSRGGSVRVDRDNFERVMERFGVALRLELPGGGASPVKLTFRELDDFSPDRLLARADVFRPLLDLRRRLADPSTFTEAAAEARFAHDAQKVAESSPAPPAQPAFSGTPADLLDLIVNQGDVNAAKAADAPSTEWSQFLSDITTPYVLRDEPRHAESIAGVEAALAEGLRAVLHHPDFRALEAVWRGIHLLTRRLETDATLTIDLIDVRRDQLTADLVSATKLDETSAYKRLVESTVGTEGAEPWALLIGNFTFAPSDIDVALLWRLGQIARLAGAPFVAAADPRFVGCASLSATPDPDDWDEPTTPAAWTELRRSDEAPYLGLILPRLILRAPYAPDSTPVETFPFVEFPEIPDRDAYLWGNPAFALALTVGRAFSEAGWSWTSAFDGSIGDLPVILEARAGDTDAVPCAEVLIRDRALDRLVGRGVMALLSVQHRDSVRLIGLNSIADPPCLLAVRSE
jgi:type VI secretion system protein ImpC